MEVKFFICETCGNLIAMIRPSGVPVMCCGKKMKELIPGTIDASLEKHVPVLEKKDHCACVKVGSVAHPMTKEHLIEWVAVKTEKGCRIERLLPEDAPEVRIPLLEGEKVEAVYAYCNLHGLWKA